MKNIIYQQIHQLTISFISKNISIAQSFPKKDKNDIVWQNYKNISFALKNLPYTELYKECVKEKAYNFMMIDYSIIQLMYRFDSKKNLISHRLAFYPNPYTKNFDEMPEEFENYYFGRTLFTENFEESNVVFPIRFDYDNDINKYVILDHPYSHLTLGNYINCRIPICSPITPFRFMHFILRNFYFKKFTENFTDDTFKCKNKFPQLLHKKETNLIHLNFL